MNSSTNRYSLYGPVHYTPSPTYPQIPSVCPSLDKIMKLIPDLIFYESPRVTFNGLKFDILVYPGHLQKNWLDFGHRLLIFLILTEWNM